MTLRSLDWRVLSETDIDAGIAEFRSRGNQAKWRISGQDAAMETTSAMSKLTAEDVTAFSTLTGHQE